MIHKIGIPILYDVDLANDLDLQWFATGFTAVIFPS